MAFILQIYVSHLQKPGPVEAQMFSAHFNRMHLVFKTAPDYMWLRLFDNFIGVPFWECAYLQMYRRYVQNVFLNAFLIYVDFNK